MLQLFFTPLSQALRLVMHLGEPLPEDKLQEVQFNYGTLFLFFSLPYLLMMWTNGVGASTGMFVPALAVGATGGTPFPLQCCSTIRHLPSGHHQAHVTPQIGLKTAASDAKEED